MPAIDVRHGDSREVLRGLPDCSIDACVTDPPYALVSIAKRFGADNAAPAQSGGTTGVYARASSGFMGKKWDTGDTAFDPAFWAEVLRVLKPGAHLIAFGGTRTYHRLVCAIEDSGFEVRDRILDLIACDTGARNFLASLNDEQQRAFVRCVEESRFGGELAWLFGSGFPKSHDVSKAIDRAAGEWRGAAGQVPRPSNAFGQEYERSDKGDPITDAARQWQGWGSALKPAHEPICLARKPLIGTIAANVLAHGTGALNIDASRIEVGDGYAENAVTQGVNTARTSFAPASVQRTFEPSQLGRWPANVIHDGSEEVLRGFPESDGQQRSVGPEHGSKPSIHTYGAFGPRDAFAPRLDSGSAARFFYTAKADAGDRLDSKHPTVKPVDLIAYLVKLITPPGGVVLDPFAGSGTTGMACMREGFDAILIEREAEYIADIKRRIAHVKGEDAPLFALDESTEPS